MSDNRYRDQNRGSYGREQRRDRSQSIFSDDKDRNRFGPDRYQEDDDRGFIERAGDEVRSWFGDDEAERRRERDARRDEQEFYGNEGSQYGGSNRSFGNQNRFGGGRGERQQTQSHYGSQHGFGGSGGEYGQSGLRGREADFDRRRETGFGSQSGKRVSANPDDHYRSWRDQQVAQLDRDYEDYCRERQQQFHSDFSSWRQTRQGQSGQPGLSGSSMTGIAGSGAAGAANASGGTGSTRETTGPGAGATTSSGSSGGSRSRTKG